jgi:hypothetical protein
MTENIKHIVALGVILLIAFGFYYLSQNDSIFKGHQQRSDEIAAETSRLKNEVIAPLRKLDNVQLGSDFFSSPEYKALQDISVPLQKPALRRDNPFAPLR